MKKTFPLRHPKKKPERMADATRAEVNKYLKRERNKALPDGFDYWDFDCKLGPDAENAVNAHVASLSNEIDKMLESGSETCYLEIIAKPAKRNKRSD